MRTKRIAMWVLGGGFILSIGACLGAVGELAPDVKRVLSSETTGVAPLVFDLPIDWGGDDLSNYGRCASAFAHSTCK